MRMEIVCALGLLLLGACRVQLTDVPAAQLASSAVVDDQALGDGAAPGNARGPGGFVSRGSARNFYAGAGGRLWYYMNNYYWVSPPAPDETVWIKTEVVERFTDLRRWPHGTTVAEPEPKVTVEYWVVGARGRSVRLDNHKDYCLIADHYTAGAIDVEVTLTVGNLEVKDDKDRWGRPREAYVLESRNYRGGGGTGPDRARFKAHPREAVTVWGYRIPFSTHPQRLTRSSWQRLELPTWTLRDRRRPERGATPVVTPRPAEPTAAETP